MQGNVLRAAKAHDYHFMENRPLEIGLGFLIVFIGCLLLYDAFDSRGKKMIWPLSKLTPW